MEHLPFDQIDWDNFFQDLPENLFDSDSIPVSDSPPTSTTTDDFSSPSSQSLSWWIEEIEGILMNDGVEDPSSSLWGKFLDDVLLQSPLAPADEVAGAPNDSVDPGGGSRGADEEKAGGNEESDEDDDNPASKKQKRQLRNKDAALIPRERKKFYVGDLVGKSKYLEGECRRLGRLLQGFITESHNGGVMTKQESVVLLLDDKNEKFAQIYTFLLLLICKLRRLSSSTKVRIPSVGLPALVTGACSPHNCGRNSSMKRENL